MSNAARIPLCPPSADTPRYREPQNMGSYSASKTGVRVGPRGWLQFAGDPSARHSGWAVKWAPGEQMPIFVAFNGFIPVPATGRVDLIAGTGTLMLLLWGEEEGAILAGGNSPGGDAGADPAASGGATDSNLRTTDATTGATQVVSTLVTIPADTKTRTVMPRTNPVQVGANVGDIAAGNYATIPANASITLLGGADFEIKSTAAADVVDFDFEA